MADQAPAAPVEGAAAVEEKKKRGKPKDEHAPPKPRNPYSRFAGEERTKLKETRPELISDLSGMGKAIADGWALVSEEKKAASQEEYDKEMAIWKPKWATYKLTGNYKEFVEVKTDYLDKKAQKKLVKTMNKEAPKKPRSGYMIFAGSIREEVMEKVKAEGLGLGDAGRLISDRWGALSEGQKGEYGEQSQKMKIAFDKENAVYLKTEAFGSFCDAKAKLESTQQQKKLTRTLLDDGPAKPSSAYALYRKEVMPGIVEENASKKDGEGKLSMGEMAKKAGEMWLKISEAKKAELSAQAEKLKAEYEIAYKEFKASKKFSSYIEKRQQVKVKENARVHLREMPKKPKSVFAMFAKDHKDEVEPGKGEGKGSSALRAKFVTASMEEKQKYEAVQAEELQKWEAEVATYKAGPKYATFEATKKKIMEEFKNEAIKVTTLKFLSDSPAAPSKTGFGVFVSEKRKASGAPSGEKKSKEAKREEVVAFQGEWSKLNAGVKEAYEEKRKEHLRNYEEEVRKFMAGEKWTEYVKEAKRMKIPIRSLLLHKKKVIQKLKDGKPNPNSIELPSKPEAYPAKPQSAMQIFVAEKKKTVELVADISGMWSKLSPEDKAEWDQKAAEQTKKFEADLEAFNKTEEGKKYKREFAGAQLRKRKLIAKNKYLGDHPVKPTSALFEFMKKNLKKAKAANPEAKGFDLKNALTQMWLQLAPEEKEPLEAASKERWDKYNADMDAFKASANWKNFLKATTVRKFTNLKKKAATVKAAPAGIPVPESMPKKPLNAFQAFCKDSTGKFKGGLSELTKAFASLAEDDKRRYLSEAGERSAKYLQELATFEKSKEGRRYRSAVSGAAKRKRLKELNEKFLKDMPKKNLTAFFLFLSGNRAKVSADNPDLKGGPALTTKLAQMWKDLSEEDRKPWVDKEKEEAAAYQTKLEEFHQTDDYKKYSKLKNHIFGIKSKVKTKKKGPRPIKMPEKPENIPQNPKSGMQVFFEETHQSGGTTDPKQLNQLWLDLGAEGQKKHMEAAAELKRKFDDEMIEFQKTAEGKKYMREKAMADRKSRLAKAKERFLGDASAPKEPKRPPSAYFIFLGQNNSSASGENASAKAKELSAKWGGLTVEEKKEYEDKAKALKEKFDEEMQVFKDSDHYKKFSRTQDVITGKHAKMAAQKAAMAKRAMMDKAKQKAAALKKSVADRSNAEAAADAAGKDDDEMGSDSSKSKKSSSSSSSSSSGSD